ncbi:MAG: hypothetical protein J6M53_06710 [Bacteroidaceae bacterium]|nr:hypothetical protein [Bacteroidaceae bacterium]
MALQVLYCKDIEKTRRFNSVYRVLIKTKRVFLHLLGKDRRFLTFGGGLNGRVAEIVGKGAAHAPLRLVGTKKADSLNRPIV